LNTEGSSPRRSNRSENLQGYLSPQFNTEQSLQFKTEADEGTEGNDSVRSTPGKPDPAANSMFIRSKYLEVGPYSSRAVQRKLAEQVGSNQKTRDLTEQVLSKSEVKTGKKLWFSPVKVREMKKDENPRGKLMMSRVEWMLQLKEIFHRLVLEFDENIFHKRYILQKNQGF